MLERHVPQRIQRMDNVGAICSLSRWKGSLDFLECLQTARNCCASNVWLFDELSCLFNCECELVLKLASFILFGIFVLTPPKFFKSSFAADSSVPWINPLLSRSCHSG